MNLDDFVLSGWPLVAWILIIAALACMVGVGLGYLNAATDLKKERSKAWRRGVNAGGEWETRRRATLPGEIITLPRDPFLGEAFMPDLLTEYQPRAVLFDQDAPVPTEAATAIELRGDD